MGYAFRTSHQRIEHHKSKQDTNAEIVAQVRAMYIEVPAEHGVIIEDTKAGDNDNEAQRAVKRLINELRSSICFYVNFPF